VVDGWSMVVAVLDFQILWYRWPVYEKEAFEVSWTSFQGSGPRRPNAPTCVRSRNAAWPSEIVSNEPSSSCS
jgi:hypothetical protein